MLNTTLTTMLSTTNTLKNNSNTTILSQPVQGYPIPFWIFLTAETLITIAGNAMLGWLFIMNKKLRTNQNYFIVSLSMSDLLVGLSIAPCEYCRIKQNIGSCSTFCGSVISFNMIASVMNLVLISTDRYLSIKKPFKYVEIFTKRRAMIVIMVTWLTTIVLTCLPLSWAWAFLQQKTFKIAWLLNISYTAILFSLTILAGICLALSYYIIVTTIRTKMRETKEGPSNPAGVKVCIISSVIFFISWIPYVVVEMYLQYVNPVDYFTHVLTIMDIAYFILILSPCLDPLLYAYYRRDFRGCLLACYRRNSAPIKELYGRMTNRGRKQVRMNDNHGRSKNGYSVRSRLVTSVTEVADSKI